MHLRSNSNSLTQDGPFHAHSNPQPRVQPLSCGPAMPLSDTPRPCPRQSATPRACPHCPPLPGLPTAVHYSRACPWLSTTPRPPLPSLPTLSTTPRPCLVTGRASPPLPCSAGCRELQAAALSQGRGPPPTCPLPHFPLLSPSLVLVPDACHQGLCLCRLQPLPPASGTSSRPSALASEHSLRPRVGDVLPQRTEAAVWARPPFRAPEQQVSERRAEVHSPAESTLLHQGDVSRANLSVYDKANWVARLRTCRGSPHTPPGLFSRPEHGGNVPCHEELLWDYLKNSSQVHLCALQGSHALPAVFPLGLPAAWLCAPLQRRLFYLSASRLTQRCPQYLWPCERQLCCDHQLALWLSPWLPRPREAVACPGG
ncbi:YLP motif-containing protein 1-like [Oryctolagus cuniculus]|uniref:YLP motif-containing protein 1-like n=1 Tax=Oryctolagus cuniculus TaxID=9986 RepID=UPI00387921F2